jgi:hypothetical protein
MHERDPTAGLSPCSVAKELPHSSYSDFNIPRMSATAVVLLVDYTYIHTLDAVLHCLQLTSPLALCSTAWVSCSHLAPQGTLPWNTTRKGEPAVAHSLQVSLEVGPSIGLASTTSPRIPLSAVLIY